MPCLLILKLDNKVPAKKIKIHIFILLFIIGISSCTKEIPVSDLSDGREGKLTFYSKNSTFKDLIENESSEEKVLIKGFLNIPNNIENKVPAVILLHGVGGVTLDIPKNHMHEIASTLNALGIAALIIDSQSTRDVRMPSELYQKVTVSMRVADAYAGLYLIATHPKIDKNRIGVMGMSRGGLVALLAQSKKIRNCFNNNDGLKFSAVVLLYPSSFLQLEKIDLINSPILLLLGEKDNITPTPMTLKYVQKIKSSHPNIEIKIYEKAYHGFDIKEFAGKKFNWGHEFSECQDRFFILEDDGMWFYPLRNERYDDGHKFRSILSDCQKSSEGILGGPKEARINSIEEYKSFFISVFNLY